MTTPGLSPAVLELVRGVLRRHPEVVSATLFGSRAKGTHTERSDVDLVVTGSVSFLGAATIAADLEELPLPIRFEVQPLAEIRSAALLDHIRRVGIVVYPEARSDSG